SNAARNSRQKLHRLAEGFALPRTCPAGTSRKPARSVSQQQVSGLLQNEKTFSILRNSSNTVSKFVQLGFNLRLFLVVQMQVSSPARNSKRLYMKGHESQSFCCLPVCRGNYLLTMHPGPAIAHDRPNYTFSSNGKQDCAVAPTTCDGRRARRNRA